VTTLAEPPLNANGIDTGYELLALIIVIVGWIAADQIRTKREDRKRAEQERRMRDQHQAMRREIGTVREAVELVSGQVINGHGNAPTSLREDLDRVISSLSNIGTKVDGLTNLVRSHGTAIESLHESVSIIQRGLLTAQERHNALADQFADLVKKPRH